MKLWNDWIAEAKKGNINIKYKDINPSYDINLLNPSKWPGLI